MKELLKAIKAAEGAEYGRAAMKFGPANNSPHESFAVILEELDEAKSEAERFGYLIGLYWTAVKRNDTGDQADKLKLMEEAALAAAAEWTQVAAMCYKATLTKEGGAENG